jgi:Zn-dependent protease with chaperone function/Zn-finger nucleic acid-binding protein
MKCQSCKYEGLVPVLTGQGVEVDYCPKCKGIWLDKGEIFYFSRKPRAFEKELREAITQGKPSERTCPRTGESMEEIALMDGQLRIDYCPTCGGMWFDAGELNKLTTQVGGAFKLRFDQNTMPAAKPGAPLPKPGALPALPNLFIRSAAVLVFLYGLIGLFLLTLTLYTALTPTFAVVIGVVIAVIQFLLGPFITDFVLGAFYNMSWVSYDGLPAYLSSFIRQTCDTSNIKYPKMGIIHDGAPNAFTYGHTPNNARIILTQGLMDLLNEDEVKGVAAHEIGHAKHWDILIMTAAQLVPLVLYYIYRTLIRVRTSREDKSAGPRMAIAIVSYVLYIVCEYIVLWLSRTREYYADRFAGEATGNPNSLTSGLVKIGYGLAGREPDKTKDKKEERKPQLAAVGALGIFDPSAGVAMAVSSLPSVSAAKKMGNEINKDNLKGAMKWDLWNPWAKYYELHSTHPLIANRIRHLGMQAAIMGREPYVVFDERKPESYWDEFLVDLLIRLFPTLSFLLFLAAFLATQNLEFIGVGIFAMGIASFLKTGFSYRAGFFPDMFVSSLLKKVKVSAVRPVPCRVKGTIIGRGIPGLIWSEDFIMQDETGIIFLDYRQPIPFWDFLFGIMSSAKYQDQEAEITGWYRRMPVPYIELKTLRAKGEKERICYTYVGKYIWAGILLSIGLVWTLIV